MEIFQPQVGVLSFLPTETLANPTTKTYFTNRGLIGANAPLGRIYHLVVRGRAFLPAALAPSMNFYIDALPLTSGPAVTLLSPATMALLAAGGTYGFSVTMDFQIASGQGTSSCALVCMGTVLVKTGGADYIDVLDGGPVMIDNTQDNALCFGVAGSSIASRTFTLRQFQQTTYDLRSA